VSVLVTFDGTIYAIPQNNEIGWGTVVTNFLLDVGNNAVVLNGTQTLTNKTIQFASGSAAAPSITFNSDATTGLFLSATGVLGLASGGKKTLTIDASGDLIMGGGTNNLTLSPASTGNPPTINATGSDNNVGINLITKGSGTVQVNGNTVLAGISQAFIMIGGPGGAAVTNGTYYITPGAPRGMTIKSAYAYTIGAGTATVAIQIAGTTVTGLSSLSATTSSTSSTNATGANSVSAGNTITAVVTSASVSAGNALLVAINYQ
jgi:hypothetical protein